MVTVFRASGNHSNRLFQAIHFEAFCKEMGLNYSNPSFEDMADYYGVEKKTWHKPFCTIAGLLHRFNLLNGLDCNDNEKQQYYEKVILKKKRALVCGWNFRVFDLTKKYQGFFMKKYALLPQYYQSNELYQRLQKIDRGRMAVVGVHIRRGDYRTWQNGKYFFADEVYQQYLLEMTSQLKQIHKEPFFVIFSNEDISIKEQDNVVISRNEWFVDQFLMSQCDYLIGPPSTFSLWASYSGKVPYYHFESGVDQLELAHFKYCIG